MLQSHYNPNKTLVMHVKEVHAAAKAITNKHSANIGNLIAQWLTYTINFHDLGKATTEFQKYISSPKSYRGNPKDKAHTPVSLFWWCVYALEQNIEPLTFIAVASAVWKHHGDFPTYDTPDGLRYALDCFEDTLPNNLKDYPIAKIQTQLKVVLPNANYDDLDNGLDEELDNLYLENDVSKKPLKEAADFRIKVQMLFSTLLEADRAYLALASEFLPDYLSNNIISLPQNLVESYFSAKKNLSTNVKLNNLRTHVRKEIIKQPKVPIATVSLPTGMGKTMIAANWALVNRYIENEDKQRKVVIVLPFLSIIDQVTKEYQLLFKEHNPQQLILEAHSLAKRIYDEDADQEEQNKKNSAIDFLAETWNSPIVITTFDQFLLILLSSKGRYQLRFHNLADALIIMDEIQAVPTKLWQPMSFALNSLTKVLNARLLIISATQPHFIENGKELAPQPEQIFANKNRYRFLLKLNNISLDTFISNCSLQLPRWDNKRVLIVVNTRACARKILDALEPQVKIPMYLISADIIPQERLEYIGLIKKNTQCLVIATQCIEAGVDIDMDLVIRDFAPLDSLIQVAGRCNRNGEKDQSDVEIVKIVNENGKPFANFVYDSILLENTLTILNKNSPVINEKQIYPIIEEYYKNIRNKKDIGQRQVENWAYWKEPLNIKSLLRSNAQKYEFIVVSEDTPKGKELPLVEEIEKALEVKDRWQRKRIVRSLQNRIAKLTISIWARNDLKPDDIAKEMGPWWILKKGYYQKGKGLKVLVMNNHNQATLSI